MGDGRAEGWGVEGGFFEADWSCLIISMLVLGVAVGDSYIRLNGFAIGVSVGTSGWPPSAILPGSSRPTSDEMV